MQRVWWLALAVLLAAGRGTSIAQPATPERDVSLTWRTSIKVGALFSQTPRAPELFPDRNDFESLVRVRTEPTVSVGARTSIAVAYEQRLRTGSHSSFASLAVLPSIAAPFRVSPLTWSIADSADAIWDHEIDRANVQLHVSRADITVGRQAIGWGRGVLFGAVDLFAPFSPLEADREWRRGVDAIRADVRITERSSVDLVAAFGRSWDTSAVGARLRGYAGSIDVELIAGRRARDLLAGVTTSAAVADAEIHGELAVFGTPADRADGNRALVWKAVAGSSYRFAIGSGVLAFAEYHYSGFGASRPEDILPLLTSPEFIVRYARGDTQILSRHAVAVSGTYERSPQLTWLGQWVLNPADGSGVIAPGFTFTLRDDTSIAGHVYLPYGRAAVGATLRSEYGTAPTAAFLQLQLYF